jgi:ankyrin repeat protein
MSTVKLEIQAIPRHFTWLQAKRRSQVVKLLLHRGDIDVNRQNYNGRTALFLAARYNHFETTKLLLGRDDIDPMSNMNAI